MSRLKSTLSLLLIFLSTSLPAQKSKITAGVVEFNQGNYESAVEKLDEGLKTPGLDNDDIAKALYYKGKSLMQLFAQAVQEKDVDKINKYAETYPKVAEYFIEAEKKDPGGKHSRLIAGNAQTLHQGLLSIGMNYINGGMDKEAIPYLEAAVQVNDALIKQNGYMAYDLAAQAHLNTGDSVRAETYFGKAISLYKNDKPVSPDFYIGYVFYRKALLERYKNGDIDAALKSLQDGMHLMDEEYKRLPASRDEAQEAAAKVYAQAMQDMKAFELDIYLNAPDKLQDAITRFEQAIKQNPENLIVHVAYASLLERVDVDKALVQYQAVLDKDPNNITALFNAGAIHVNKAKDINEIMVNTENDTEYSRLNDQMNGEMKKAYPLFKKVYELQPDDLSAIRALKQITITLEMQDEYARYREAEKSLQN